MKEKTKQKEISECKKLKFNLKTISQHFLLISARSQYRTGYMYNSNSMFLSFFFFCTFFLVGHIFWAKIGLALSWSPFFPWAGAYFQIFLGVEDHMEREKAALFQKWVCLPVRMLPPPSYYPPAEPMERSVPAVRNNYVSGALLRHHGGVRSLFNSAKETCIAGDRA